MIKKILNVNPKKRITLEEIKNHSFYKNGEKLLNSDDKNSEFINSKIEEKTMNNMFALGFKKEEIELNLKFHKHNEITTTYDLLFQKFYKIEKKIKSQFEFNNKDLTFYQTLPTTNSNIETKEKENLSNQETKIFENKINIQIKYEKKIGNININISEPSQEPEYDLEKSGNNTNNILNKTNNDTDRNKEYNVNNNDNNANTNGMSTDKIIIERKNEEKNEKVIFKDKIEMEK